MIAVYTLRNSSVRLLEKLERQRIPARVVNTPRELSLGCGLSVEFNDRDFNCVKNVIASTSNTGFAGVWRNYMGVWNRIY